MPAGIRTCVLDACKTPLSSIAQNECNFDSPARNNNTIYTNVIVKSIRKTMTMRMSPRSSDSGSRRFAEHPHAKPTQPAVDLHINIILYNNIPLYILINTCSIYVQYVYTAP